MTRNLGYGFTNTGARCGGLPPPFVIDLDSRMVLSYLVMAGLLATCGLLCFFIDETKGRVLSDSITQQNNNVKATLSLRDVGTPVEGRTGSDNQEAVIVDSNGMTSQTAERVMMHCAVG